MFRTRCCTKMHHVLWLCAASLRSLFKTKWLIKFGWGWRYISSGVSHSDGSCVLGRIHSDVSSYIPKKVYHIVMDNFVNLLHISYAWLYKTECWGRKFHAFSFNSHRNCKIFMTNFNFIFDTICVPYIFWKSIFGWNCDHDMPLCDTPLLEDTPLCDTPDDLFKRENRKVSDMHASVHKEGHCVNPHHHGHVPPAGASILFKVVLLHANPRYRMISLELK